MPAVLRCELFKLTRRMMARALVSLVAGGTLIAYVLLAALPDDGTTAVEKLRVDHVPDDGMFVIYQISMVAAVAMAASTIATEYGWGTIRTLLPRTAGRSAFLAAKILSLGLFVALVVLLGFAAALAGSALATELRSLDSSLGPDFAGRALESVAKTILAVLPYCALAFLVGLWTRSSAAGIAIPIVAFYTEVLLTPLFASTSVLDWLPNVLIYNNITVLLDSSTLVPKEDLPVPWQSAGVLAAYLTVFVSLAFGRFLTRDVP